MLFFLVLFSGFSLHMMRTSLLDNAQIMGSEIASGYATHEEVYIAEYTSILKNTAKAIEVRLQEQQDISVIRQWLRDYQDYVHDTMGIEGIEIYATAYGKIAGATYWEGDDLIDPTQTTWYQMAMESGGEIIFTPTYIDQRLNSPTLTMAMQIEDTDSVIAVDIYPEQFTGWSKMDSLPEDSRYFLFDSEGFLLHYNGFDESEIPEFDSYTKELFSEIKKGLHDVSSSYITDPDGEKRGVYYSVTPNGWVSVITIPYDYLLSGTEKIFVFYLSSIVFISILSVLFLVRDWHLNQKVKLTNDVVRVLGNSYYALYLVNVEQGTYTIIKASDYVRQNLPEKGTYMDFLHTLKDITQADVYHDIEQTFSLQNIRELVKKRVKNFGGDFQRLFNDQYRWVNIRMLFDESLRPNEVILCFRDIEEEKQAQLNYNKLLQDSLKTSQEIAKTKNMFFSNMSHDMRTPLNAIIGLSELASNHLSSPDKIKEYLQKINLSSKHLLGLINDILEISRLEQGKLELNKASFPIQQEMQELFSIFEIQAQKNEKHFSSKFEIQNKVVIGDWFRIQQILNNLLSNAIKYTLPGDHIDVTVREIPHEGSGYSDFQIIVSDTGVGMDKDFLEKLFIPFERDVRFGAKNVSGTGLGMPIIQNLIMQMDGEINVESELGKGSIFTVTLPLYLEQNQNHDTEKAKSSEQYQLEGKHVLLVEDNEINMEIATEILTIKNIHVTQAWNGKEAVDLFSSSEQGTFDFILMDMQMPVMGGCEATKQIRSLPREDAKSIPIIAVTANAFSEDIAETMAAGMNAHISKPIDLNILYSTLESLS